MKTFALWLFKHRLLKIYKFLIHKHAQTKYKTKQTKTKFKYIIGMNGLKTACLTSQSGAVACGF